MPNDLPISRRHLIAAGTAGVATLALAQELPPPTPTDTGKTTDGKIQFPSWTAPTERPTGGPPDPMPVDKRVGFAVVALGRLSLENILPAFGQSKKARPVALVSGSPDKAKTVAAQYGIQPEAIYGYERFEDIRNNPDIQAVYIVLPNAMHKEFVLRAAKAGKHVLCEKPMATSSADAKQMVEGCRAAERLLMIAYRCQYEPYNRKVISFLRDGKYGTPKLIRAVNVQNMAAPEQWRLKKKMAGGGSLPDVGIYCLNAARYLTGEEPVEVYAQIASTPNDPRFREVEETVSFSLRFGSGIIADCSTSYGMHESRYLHVHTDAGTLQLENAFAYEGQQLRVSHRADKAESIDQIRLSQKHQFALEMDHMADCILTGRKPHTPGEEGVQDHVVMEAIYRSAATNRPVSLPKVEGKDVTRGPAPEES
ncbi:MAG: Gfo/Idh/MocA family protein [Bryobacteraceae bacterium]